MSFPERGGHLKSTGAGKNLSRGGGMQHCLFLKSISCRVETARCCNGAGRYQHLGLAAASFRKKSILTEVPAPLLPSCCLPLRAALGLCCGVLRVKQRVSKPEQHNPHSVREATAFVRVPRRSPILLLGAPWLRSHHPPHGPPAVSHAKPLDCCPNWTTAALLASAWR